MPPRITSRGFIKGTVTPRIRTYSDPDNLKADLSTFKAKLTERGYKHNEIEHCFEKALTVRPQRAPLGQTKKQRSLISIHHQIQPHLKNLRKALTEDGTAQTKATYNNSSRTHLQLRSNEIETLRRLSRKKTITKKEREHPSGQE